MDWGNVVPTLFGALIGAGAAIATAEFEFRRTRLDRLREQKLGVYADYLGLLFGMPRQMTKMKATGQLDEIEALVAEMQSLEARLHLLAPPDVNVALDAFEEWPADASYGQLKELVSEHTEALVQIMRTDLGETTSSPRSER